jgi:hypothetical protein
MTALDRLRAAVAGKVRGDRGDRGQHHLVEVLAADLVEAAHPHRERSPVAAALHQGAQHSDPLHRVCVQVDDVYHLIDRAEAPAAEPAA